MRGQADDVVELVDALRAAGVLQLAVLVAAADLVLDALWDGRARPAAPVMGWRGVLAAAGGAEPALAAAADGAGSGHC